MYLAASDLTKNGEMQPKNRESYDADQGQLDTEAVVHYVLLS